MSKKRIVIYGLILVCGVLLVLRQQKIVIANRSKEKVSNFSEWQKNGKPVILEKVQKQTVKIYSKITAVRTADQEFESYVSRSIQEKLRSGQSFYVQGEKQKREGQVLSVSDQRDMDTGLFQVKLSLAAGAKNLLKTIVGYVNTSVVDNAICVSNDVIDKQGNDYVLWISEGGKARKRIITIQQRDGYGVIIAGGLQEGDLVIKEGFNHLLEGDKLNILKSQESEEK